MNIKIQPLLFILLMITAIYASTNVTAIGPDEHDFAEYIKEYVQQRLDSYLWQLENPPQEYVKMNFRGFPYKREDFNTSMTKKYFEDFRYHILEYQIETIFKKIKELEIPNQKTLIFDVRDHEYNLAEFYDFLMTCVDDYDNIESMNIGPKGYSFIKISNKKNKTNSIIKIVEGKKLQDTDTDMKILSNMINKMPKLQSLHLNDHKITEKRFGHLLSNLQIPKLNVYFSDIHGFSQVTNQTVKELALVDTELTDDDANVLSEMDLTNLNVRDNNITFEGFINILKISRMQTLDISANDLDQNINDDNLKKLTDMLDDTEFQHLERLKLDHNKLGKYNAKLITILHQKYKKLKDVELKFCNIDDDTAVTIVESFLQLPEPDETIHINLPDETIRINLSYNKITTKGFKKILELSNTHGDKRVHLSLNGNAGCVAKKATRTDFCAAITDNECHYRTPEDCKWIALIDKEIVDKSKWPDNWKLKI